MTSVIIHGKLGKIFGENHVFKVNKMSEVVNAINANSPGFKQKILSDCRTGNDYYFLDAKNGNKEYKRPEEFLNSKPPEELHIVPIICGSGGLEMFFVGFIMSAAAYGPAMTKIATFFFMVGVSLMIQGIMTILFPIEPPDQISRELESKIDTSSYIFSSLKNNAVQGFPIPLLYGELRVGSNIISTNVISEDLGGPGNRGATATEAEVSSVGGSSSGGGTSGGTTITIDTDGDGVGDTVINVGGSDGGAAGGGGGGSDS